MVGHGIESCAKYSINPGMAHWYALLRILRYLEGTKGYGLLFRRQPRDVEFGCYAERVPDYQLDPQYLPKGVNRPSDGSLHIYAHIDSDHARDLDTRRSVTACAIFGNGTLQIEDATYCS